MKKICALGVFFVFILVTSPTEAFCSDESKFITQTIKGVDRALGVDETVKNVIIENGNLIVLINLKNTTPSSLSFQDLAYSRNSSVTDKILQISKEGNYDNLWQKIIVKFIKVGKIINNKNDIKTNEYGSRYFESRKFKLLNEK